MFQNPKTIICFLASFNALRMFIGAVSSFYLLTHGMDIVTLGFLKSLQSLIFFLFDVPSSYLADKYSRKWAIIIAILLGGFWLLLTGFGQNNTIFFVAEILNSFSLTIFGGVFFAYVVDVSKDTDRSKQLFNKINRLQFLFMGVTSLIGSGLYMLNPKLPWLLSGTLCLILGFIGIYSLPESKRKINQEKVNLKKVYKTIKTSNKKLFIEGLNLALLLVFFQVLLQYWQPLFQDAFPTQANGLFFGIIFSLTLIVQSLFGHFAIKLEKITFFDRIISSLAIIWPLAIYFFSHKNESLLFAVFFILLFGIMQSLIATSRGHYHCMLQSNIRSIYDSLTTTLSKLIAIFILPLIGYMANTFGWNAVILFLPALAVLNLFLRFKY